MSRQEQEREQDDNFLRELSQSLLVLSSPSFNTLAKIGADEPLFATEQNLWTDRHPDRQTDTQSSLLKWTDNQTYRRTDTHSSFLK